MVGAGFLALGLAAAGAVGWSRYREREARRDFERRRTVAVALMQAGQAADACDAFEALLAEKPGNFATENDLMLARFAAERWDGAAELAELILVDRPRHAPAHAVIARIAARRDDLDTALAAAVASAEGDAVPHGAQVLVAEILLRQGRATEAMERLDIAARDDGLTAEQIRSLRLVQATGSDLELSAEVRAALMREVVAAREQLAEVVFDRPATARLAVAFVLLGRMTEARDLLERTQAARELTEDELSLLTRAQSAVGDHAAASLSADDLAARVGDRDALLVARTYRWGREPEKALAALSVPLAERPNDRALLRERLRVAVVALEAAGDPAAAEAVCASARAVLDVAPRDQLALEARSLALLALDDAEGALADLDALGSTPAVASPRVLWLRALALLRLGRRDSALNALPTPDSIDVGPTAALLIVRACLSAGRVDTALAWESRLTGPTSTALAAALAALDGRTADALAATATPAWSACAGTDRYATALALVQRGETRVADALATSLTAAGATLREHLLAGELFAVIGRHADAAAAFERAAADDTLALRAVSRLGEIVALHPDATTVTLDDVLRRLDRLPDAARVRLRLEGLHAIRLGDLDGALRAATALDALEDADARLDARVLRLRALPVGLADEQELRAAVDAVLELDPRNHDALRRRADLLLDDARSVLDSDGATAAERVLDPEGTADDPLTRPWVALLRLGRWRPGDVIASARTLLGDPDTRPSGDLLLGLALGLRGEWDAAADALARAAAARPGRRNVEFFLAMAALRAGRVEAARQAAERLAAIDPDSSQATALLALALDRGGERDAARARLDDAVALRPSDLPLRILRGRLLLAQGDPAAALTRLDADVVQFPDAPDLLTMRTLALLSAGRRDDAVAAADAVFARGSTRFTGRLLRAHLARVARDHERETTELRAALDEQPDAAVVHARLGRLLLGLGRRVESRAHLARAVELAPGDAASRAGLAMLVADAGEAELAETLYRETLDLDPDNALAANNLASALIARKGHGPEAVALARRATRAAPRTGACFDTLSRALVAVGDVDGALVAGERAASLAPRDVEIGMHLARVTYLLGRLDDSRRHLARIRAVAAEEGDAAALVRIDAERTRLDDLQRGPSETPPR